MGSVNHLDHALQRHHEAVQASTEAADKSVALLTDFADRMRGLGFAPIPIGYYEDLGATGWLGQRRSAIFKPKEMGWVLPRKMEGMFVTEDGRLFKGQPLSVVGAGQKRHDEIPYVNFWSPPKNGFAFCFNRRRLNWTAHESWTFREIPDAAAYVGDLAAALARHGG